MASLIQPPIISGNVQVTHSLTYLSSCSGKDFNQLSKRKHFHDGRIAILSRFSFLKNQLALVNQSRRNVWSRCMLKMPRFFSFLFFSFSRTGKRCLTPVLFYFGGTDTVAASNRSERRRVTWWDSQLYLYQLTSSPVFSQFIIIQTLQLASGVGV